MSMLATSSQISQIFIAAFTAVVAVIAYMEWSKSKETKKIDLAVGALKLWDDKINELTGPAISLVRNNKNNNDVLIALKNCQEISFSSDQKSYSYGFLVNTENKIPADITNKLKMSLVHYINAWESVVVLYNTGRADKTLIEDQLITDQRPAAIFSALWPYMELYGEHSWQPLRTMKESLKNIEIAS